MKGETLGERAMGFTLGVAKLVAKATQKEKGRSPAMTMTGDEVRKQVSKALNTKTAYTSDGARVVDKHTQILVDLADKVLLIDSGLKTESQQRMDRHEQLQKRVKALEQKSGAEPVDLSEPPPVSPLPVVGRVMGTFVATEEDSDG